MASSFRVITLQQLLLVCRIQKQIEFLARQKKRAFTDSAGPGALHAAGAAGGRPCESGFPRHAQRIITQQQPSSRGFDRERRTCQGEDTRKEGIKYCQFAFFSKRNTKEQAVKNKHRITTLFLLLKVSEFNNKAIHKAECLFHCLPTRWQR